MLPDRRLIDLFQIELPILLAPMAGGFTTRVAYDQAQEALRTAEGSLETAKAQLGTSTDALSYTQLRASAEAYGPAGSAEPRP